MSDIIAYIIAVEEEFDIAINDSDVEQLETPRLVAKYVSKQLSYADEYSDNCLTKARFNKLRRILVKEFGAKHDTLKPESLTKNFLYGNIREEWERLSQLTSKGRLPSLKCTKTLFYSCLAVFPISLAMILGLSSQISPLTHLVVINSFVASFSLWAILQLYVSNKIADQIPKSVETVAQLTSYIKMADPKTLSFEEVLERVIQLAAYEFNISAEKIEPDQRFIEDLKII